MFHFSLKRLHFYKISIFLSITLSRLANPFKYFSTRLTFCESFRYPWLFMLISAIIVLCSFWCEIAHNMHRSPRTIVVNGGYDIFSMLLSIMYITYCEEKTCRRNIKSRGRYNLLYAFIFKYIIAEFYDFINVFNPISSI